MNDLGLGFKFPSPQVQSEIAGVLRSKQPGRRAGMQADEILRTAPREEILAAVASQRGLTFMPGVTDSADPHLIEKFDPGVMKRGLMVPIELNEKRVHAAVGDPYNTTGKDFLKQKYPGHEISLCLVPSSEVEAILERLSAGAGVSREALDALDAIGSESEIKDFVLSEKYSDPVQETMRGIFLTAVTQQASDIHITVGHDNTFYVALRVNGSITPRLTLDQRLQLRVDAYLLSLCGLQREDAVTNIGMSGRFSLVAASGRRIDARYERHKTFRGYHITIRLLDKSRVDPRLGQGSMAFDDNTLLHLRRAMALSDGIIIISGPTGSGKTTTLNAILREVAQPEYTTLTLENPVEYEIPGVIHCNMRSNDDFGFYIRSFMRSDPDIMLMGEIRDLASAKLAIEAAMTGHQVFTTIHTNSAIEILDRIEHLGIDPRDVASTVRLLAAQRLVKTLCKECSTEAAITKEMAAIYSIPEDLIGAKIRARRRDGCRACDHRGYTGRVAVMEILPIDREACKLIVEEKQPHDIEEFIRKKHGLKTLQQQGIDLLVNGTSDIESIRDVINLGY